MATAMVQGKETCVVVVAAAATSCGAEVAAAVKLSGGAVEVAETFSQAAPAQVPWCQRHTCKTRSTSSRSNDALQ